VPVAFQVEFPRYGPFSEGIRVVRSLFQETQPLTVGLPRHYNRNLAFKYTVTIANGWSDDPIVQPPPPNDGFIIQTTSTSTNVITLSVDATTGVLSVSPLSPSFPAGAVTWQWATGSNPADIDDFTVTFADSSLGTGQETSNGGVLALNLKAGGPVGYTVQTLDTGLSATDKLTITP
jgi:hypothetical protein